MIFFNHDIRAEVCFGIVSARCLLTDIKEREEHERVFI